MTTDSPASTAAVVPPPAPAPVPIPMASPASAPAATAAGPPLRIAIVTPAPPGSRKGNRVTARRWAGILRGLGHRIAVVQEYGGEPCDVLVALHASKSHDSIARFRRDHPDRPRVVALTGTDLYGDIRTDRRAQQSLEWATRLIALQPMAVDELPPPLRAKVRVIYQSCVAPPGYGPGQVVPKRAVFEVGVIGHLRAVKDPFRTAQAARLLPPSSRIRVLHLGGILDPEMAQQARDEMAANPRYRWLGDLPRWRTLRILARCRLLALTSVLEGGANVVTEAIACGVPVIASRIPGSLGLLGTDYPGYFPTGDTAALAALLRRAETDGAFYAGLKARCDQLRWLADPAEERRRWAALLHELALVREQAA